MLYLLIKIPIVYIIQQIFPDSFFLGNNLEKLPEVPESNFCY